MAHAGHYALLALIWLVLASGCTRLAGPGQTPIKAETRAQLQEILKEQTPDLELFRLRGPFAVTVHKNHEIRLSPTERISADLYLSAPPGTAPLVILMHGYDSSKEAHGNQAMHLASWGIHSLSVQLPRKGPWIGNGRTLARTVSFVHRTPEVLDKRIDVNKIILVGHSFGAASVATALGEGAPALGAILLDPAYRDKGIPKFLQQIRKPVMVIGADDSEYQARNRDDFYNYIRGGVAEVSIADAAHEDGQYPSEFALHNGGNDPHTSEELQLTFVSALTAAALSLSSTGTFDYAWSSFGIFINNGRLFNPRKK